MLTVTFIIINAGVNEVLDVVEEIRCELLTSTGDKRFPVLRRKIHDSLKEGVMSFQRVVRLQGESHVSLS